MMPRDRQEGLEEQNMQMVVEGKTDQPDSVFARIRQMSLCRESSDY